MWVVAADRLVLPVAPGESDDVDVRVPRQVRMSSAPT